ncbi:MAG: dephospho-CoA kinase [Phycisphaerales bacterium]|nr:dephospho-CoA kinase [Phycisphaerales bacterium]
MSQRKPVIGLTGAIGSGKSRVAAALAELGCLVIDSDKLGHEVTEQPDVIRELTAWWGPDILRPDGRLDRRKIAQIVFADRAEKSRLEALVHPLIAERRRAMIAGVDTHSAIKAIVLDSPLLLESNLACECDAVVFVHASDQQRLRRVRERGWDAQELARRERWQLPVREKRARADFVIDNDGSPEAIGPQAARVLEQVLERHGAGAAERGQ